MKKKWVKKPQMRNGSWVVVVADGPGPLAEELEVFYCGGHESAFNTYRRIMKELGRGL